jgi:hypothetical protein
MTDETRVKLRSDTTDVWRVGDTVRRPAHSGSGAVRSLLAYLRSQGFTYPPEHLGTDDDGREVFSWIDGEALGEDMTDDQLAAVGRLLREYHDVVRGFRPDPSQRWRTSSEDPRDWPIIMHNDVNPGNIIWRGNRIVGLIDWDFAKPGTADQDLAYAAMRCVPLFDPGPHDRRQAAHEQARRTLILCGAYRYERLPDLPEEIARMVIDSAAQRARLSAAGDPGFQRYWAKGLCLGFFAGLMSWLSYLRPILEQHIAASHGRPSARRPDRVDGSSIDAT